MSEFRRIVVVGNTGSGKSTLAARLATLLRVPHVELDALFWEPGWTEARPDAFRRRGAAAVAGPGWVADGNYSKVRDLVWGRADTLIWLDYPLWVNLWRLLRRSLWRSLFQPELWNGNRECLRNQFLSWDSLFVWAVKTSRRRRREYARLLAQPEYAHLRALQYCSPGQTRRWLAEVAGSRGSCRNPTGTPGNTDYGAPG
jgi:adenylate kinase family enzyme